MLCIYRKQFKLDISYHLQPDQALRYMECRGCGLRYFHAAAHAGAYDVVCSFQVREHGANPAGFLTACMACLKPDGTRILSTPNASSFVDLPVNCALNLPLHRVTTGPRRPGAAWSAFFL